MRSCACLCVCACVCYVCVSVCACVFCPDNTPEYRRVTLRTKLELPNAELQGRPSFQRPDSAAQTLRLRPQPLSTSTRSTEDVVSTMTTRGGTRRRPDSSASSKDVTSIQTKCYILPFQYIHTTCRKHSSACGFFFFFCRVLIMRSFSIKQAIYPSQGRRGSEDRPGNAGHEAGINPKLDLDLGPTIFRNAPETESD